MPLSEQRLLEFIRNKLEPATHVGDLLAIRAQPDFLWQDELVAADLSTPLAMGRHADLEMLGSMERLRVFYDIVDFLACQEIAMHPENQVSTVELYIFIMSLSGICFCQLPESAEFGIAARCWMVVCSAESVGTIGVNLTADFLGSLNKHVSGNLSNYWDPSWLLLSLRVSHVVLSMQVSGRSGESRGRLLSELATTRSEVSPLTRQHGNFDEALFMDALLSRCHSQDYQ